MRFGVSSNSFLDLFHAEVLHVRTISRTFADLSSAINGIVGRFRCRLAISMSAREGMTISVLTRWLVIHSIALSTTGAACGMSNLDNDSLPDDLISYAEEQRINLDMYVIERVERRRKLVIYLLDKDLPKGYRGSRPGVPQYEFMFDRATKKLLGVSLIR